MRQRRNFRMPERSDAVSNRGVRLGIVLSVGILQSLPGKFGSSQMFRLALLLGNAMRVRGDVL
jgi:hypothetical protein